MNLRSIPAPPLATVPAKFGATCVLVSVVALACTPLAKERPSQEHSAQRPVSEPLPAVRPITLTPAAAKDGPPKTLPPEEPPSPEPSAYVGCGTPIPPRHFWLEQTEGEVLDAITSAKRCAAEQGRKLLLEFVAPWCNDCREMAKLDETAVVAEALRERFERVRINVGQWDRHEGLRRSYDVRALATYIVIDPKTSKVLAKTTLEPISKPGQRLSAEQWAGWLKAH